MADNDERLFLQVVEAGSLKAAAAQLAIDPSAVSRRIGALESRLGVQLLRRSTRGSKPTDAGHRYYDGMRSIVDQQDALEAEVTGSEDTPRGLLRVTAPLEFGARFVVGVLAELHESTPDLEVDLQLGSGFVDLEAHAIDVAIRIGALEDSSMITRRLGVVPRVLVGSPAYFARHGIPQSPDDFDAHEFIGYRRSGPTASFPFTTPTGGTTTAVLRSTFTVNSIASIVRLVEEGRGLHLGPLWAFADSLESGRLTAILTDYGLPAYPLNALYAPRSFVPAKIRSFVDLMVDRVAAEPTLSS